MARTSRSSLWLPGVALALTATLALAASCGPVQQAADETATAEAMVGAIETDTPAASATATSDPGTAQPTVDEPGSPTALPTATFTPEPTMTPLATFRFPGTRPIPPAEPDDAMVQTGYFWIDAGWSPVGSLVARIGDEICGIGRAIYPNRATFTIEIRSAAQQPGCGTEGAEVLLSMDGLDANGSFPWQPGQQQFINVVRGPAFGLYSGDFQVDSNWIPVRVVPLIDGKVCGKSLNGAEFQGFPVTSYSVVVDPDALVSGCGREGASVTIVVTGRVSGIDGPEEERVIDTVPWQTGALVERPEVDARRIPSRQTDPSR